MPDDLVVRADLVIPGGELEESASRAGGPGGQHVNKTSTRVSLRWRLADSRALAEPERARLRRRLASRLTREGDLLVHAGGTRSRARNREIARERLATLVREALVLRRARRPTRPGRGARERRLEGKRQRGAVKRTRGPVRGERD